MAKKTLYQKYIAGDSLTNKEVLEGIQVFTDAYLSTWKLGSEFRLVSKEFARVAVAFKEFAEARKLN